MTTLTESERADILQMRKARQQVSLRGDIRLAINAALRQARSMRQSMRDYRRRQPKSDYESLRYRHRASDWYRMAWYLGGKLLQ